MKITLSKKAFLELQEKYITDEKMSKRLGVSKTTVWNYRNVLRIMKRSGKLPKYVQKIDVFKATSLKNALTMFINKNNISKRIMTKMCELKSASLLYDIEKINRPIGIVNLMRIMKVMKLNTRENMYFEALANMHNAKKDEIKGHYNKHLKYISK